MKSIINKIIYFVLILMFLIALPSLAPAINNERINMPSSQWEERFIAIINEMKMIDTDKPVFTISEHPGYGFEHALDLSNFIRVAYYDKGDGAFDSAVLTIDLDGVGKLTEQVWYAIIATTFAGERRATTDQVIELVNAICPIFDQILAGKERVTGAQTATLHGVGYGLEFYEHGRFARFYTNANLTRK